MAMILAILLPTLILKQVDSIVLYGWTHDYPDVEFALVDDGNANTNFIMSWDRQ